MDFTVEFPVKISRKSSSTRSSESFASHSQSSDSIGQEATPNSPLAIPQVHLPDLATYEQEESLQYEKIYYISKCSNISPENFTDKQGNFIGIPGDHIAHRYEILNFLGRGAFAQVFECLDHKLQEKVAIKILNKKALFTQSGKNENNLLNSLNESGEDEWLLKKFSSFEFRGHFCIVFEILSLNLYQMLKQNYFKGLSMEVIKKIAVGVLNTLKVLHGIGYVHCDLKPENLMLKNGKINCWKIIDFGSALCSTKELIEYVQSRPYRAPEVVLGCQYNEKVDVWSLGCVLFECFQGTQLFPAEDERELLLMMQDTIGRADPGLIDRARFRELYFRNGVVQGEHWRNKKLNTLLASNDGNFVDFISKCLKWSPDERISAESGLSHPWISS